MSNFYVYENWTHDHARIHRVECAYCNDGHGMHSGASLRNGKWHGPYDRDIAFRVAGSLSRSGGI
jgi:hypothetical protein